MAPVVTILFTASYRGRLAVEETRQSRFCLRRRTSLCASLGVTGCWLAQGCEVPLESDLSLPIVLFTTIVVLYS